MVESGEHRNETPRHRRRLDLILILAFAVMLTAGAAVFPLSVAANQLSGLWMTFCASIGWT